MLGGRITAGFLLFIISFAPIIKTLGFVYLICRLLDFFITIIKSFFTNLFINLILTCQISLLMVCFDQTHKLGPSITSFRGSVVANKLTHSQPTSRPCNTKYDYSLPESFSFIIIPLSESFIIFGDCIFFDVTNFKLFIDKNLG